MTYTVAMECETETLHNVFLFPFSEGIFFFFDIALRFKLTLNALKNLTAIVAIVGLQTNSSMLTHPDRNGTLGNYCTLVVFLSAYFVHNRLVAPLKSPSHSSNLS